MELERNLMNVKTLRTQLSEIESKLPSLLDQFKTNYVLYHNETDNEEYFQAYINIKNNVEKLNKDLTNIENNIENNTIELNTRMEQLNLMIQEERKKNRELKFKLGLTENKYNSSEEMINDYVEMYNIDYLKNFTMIIGILGLSAFLYKNFTKPQI
jgi:DNA repair exonuclease SbcCD ATPase subunit